MMYLIESVVALFLIGAIILVLRQLYREDRIGGLISAVMVVFFVTLYAISKCC